MRVQAPAVRTKSVYQPSSPEDGRRVLVTQYWPRGIPRTAVDEYVRRLAPSRDLLHAFKRGEIDWEAYKVSYREEMEGEEATGEIRRLAEAARSETITVMCVCKDENSCHRSALRELIVDQPAPGRRPGGPGA